MKFTKKEEQELSEAMSAYPIVRKMYEEIKAYNGDDAVKSFHLQLTRIMKTLSDDMKLIVDGSKETGTILNNKTDEKIFERVNIVVDKAEKYYAAIQKGNQIIDPDSVKKEAAVTGDAVPLRSRAAGDV